MKRGRPPETAMRRAKPILLTMTATLALLGACDVLFAQCAMCRTGLLNSAEGQKLVSGFNKAILFLLSAPFLVAAVVAFSILRARLNMPLRQAVGRKYAELKSRRRPQGVTLTTAPRHEVPGVP